MSRSTCSSSGINTAALPLLKELTELAVFFCGARTSVQLWAEPRCQSCNICLGGASPPRFCNVCIALHARFGPILETGLLDLSYCTESCCCCCCCCCAAAAKRARDSAAAAAPALLLLLLRCCCSCAAAKRARDSVQPAVRPHSLLQNCVARRPQLTHFCLKLIDSGRKRMNHSEHI